jgi:hypothetical protein
MFLKDKKIPIEPSYNTTFSRVNSIISVNSRFDDVSKSDHKYTKEIKRYDATWWDTIWGNDKREVTYTNHSSYAKELRKESLSVASNDIANISLSIENQVNGLIQDIESKITHFIA